MCLILLLRKNGPLAATPDVQPDFIPLDSGISVIRSSVGIYPFRCISC